jgi:hypothetical protein
MVIIKGDLPVRTQITPYSDSAQQNLYLRYQYTTIPKDSQSSASTPSNIKYYPIFRLLADRNREIEKIKTMHHDPKFVHVSTMINPMTRLHRRAWIVRFLCMNFHFTEEKNPS